MRELAPAFIAILREPLTGNPLRQEGNHLVALNSGVSYAIVEGIPVLLPQTGQSGADSDAQSSQDQLSKGHHD